MAKLRIYCITNKQSDKLEKLSVNLVGVGRNSFNSNYLKSKCDSTDEGNSRHI